VVIMKLGYIGAAVIMLVILSIIMIFIVGDPSKSDWNEYNEYIDGSFDRSVTIHYSDGTEEEIGTNKLSLYHNGNEMIGVTLRVDAEAHSATGDCPWETVQVSIDNTNLRCFYGSSGNTIWSTFDEYSGFVDLQVDGSYVTIYDSYFDLETPSNEGWADGNIVWFDLIGELKFRGLSQTDIGEWCTIEDVYLPSLGIDNGIDVNWESEPQGTIVKFNTPLSAPHGCQLHYTLLVKDGTNIGSIGGRIVWDNSKLQYVMHEDGDFTKMYTSITSGETYDYMDIIAVDSSIGEPDGFDINVVDITFIGLSPGEAIIYIGENQISPNPYMRLSDDTVGMSTMPISVEDGVIQFD